MQVRVIRSARRRKTVSASLSEGILVVRVPASCTAREEQEWVRKMQERLLNRASRRRLPRDEDLQRRADDLAARYLGRALDFTIHWVTNQQRRWGSCTPAARTIRISRELARMPRYVLEYVVIHELAHLVHADHSPRFWAMVRRYPHADRAMGFLAGYAFPREGTP